MAETVHACAWLCALGALLLAAVDARAAVPSGSVYDVDVGSDGAATLSMIAAAVLMELEKPEWSGTSPCPGREASGHCDASLVNPLDRLVIGNRSELSSMLSNVLLNLMIAAPLAVSAGDALISHPSYPGRRTLEDSLVGLESMAAAAVATEIIKIGVRRPRPFTYDEAVARDVRFDGDARLSFPSGHSSITFASATAMTVTAFERHSVSPEALIVASATYAAAALTAYLRTASGKHFYTDVLAGAAIGIASGVLVTHFHLRDVASGATASALSGEAKTSDSRHDVSRPMLMTLQGAW
jgi:membrane-associated phospholipid phosphatase